MQMARMDLNEGNSRRRFDAIAVFEDVMPELSDRALRRS